MATAPTLGTASLNSDYQAKFPYVDFLVLNNASLTTGTSTSPPYYIGGAISVELLAYVTTFSGSGVAGEGIAFTLNTIEPASGGIVDTLATAKISKSGGALALVAYVNNDVIGDTVSLSWTTSKVSADPVLNGVYARIIAKS